MKLNIKSILMSLIAAVFLLGVFIPSNAQVHAKTDPKGKIENLDPANTSGLDKVQKGYVRLIVTYNQDLPKGQRKKLITDESLTSEDQLEYLPIGYLVVPEDKKDKTIEKLKKKKGIMAVEEDHINKADFEPNTEWDMTQLNLPNAWNNLSLKGDGVKIGVLDSGLNKHPDIDEARIIKRWSVYTVLPDSLGFDDHGHGTHVTGTIIAKNGNGIGIRGIAPNADLYSYRVLDEKGEAYDSQIIKGIEQAIIDRVDVLNMSLGGSQDSMGERVAFDIAANKYGILIAKAVGNEGNADTSREVTDPVVRNYLNPTLANPSVIGVAAVDSNNQRGIFSSTGAGIDFSSYGVQTLSTTKDGGYEAWNGTSMASPHVAGLLGLYHQAYGDNVEYTRMAANTVPLGDSRLYGKGLAKAPTGDTNMRVTYTVQSKWANNIFDMINGTDTQIGWTFWVRDKTGKALPGYTVSAYAYYWAGMNGDDLRWNDYPTQYASYKYTQIGSGPYFTGTTAANGSLNVWFTPVATVQNPNWPYSFDKRDDYRIKVRVTSPTGDTYEKEIQFRALKK